MAHLPQMASEDPQLPDRDTGVMHHLSLCCYGDTRGRRQLINRRVRITHFNIYVNPSGKSFSIIATGPGSVQAGTETRVN